MRPEATTTSVPQIRLSIMSSEPILDDDSEHHGSVGIRTHAIVLSGALNGRRDAVRVIIGLIALSSLTTLGAKTHQQCSQLNPYDACCERNLFWSTIAACTYSLCFVVYFTASTDTVRVRLTRWHVNVYIFKVFMDLPLAGVTYVWRKGKFVVNLWIVRVVLLAKKIVVDCIFWYSQRSWAARFNN